MKAIDEPFYWYARGTRLHTGITYPGQQTDSGAPEFECGTKEEIILKLEKHRDELPTEGPGFINTENGIEFVEVENASEEMP